MPRKPVGVFAAPGQLTRYLDQLDLSRKDLSEMLEVSVRTVHNIEHGRHRVDRRLLKRVADVLNRVAREGNFSVSLALTEDNFVRDPDAAANVFLRSILINDCRMLFAGETSIAVPDLRWCAAGQQDAIPFAGQYQGKKVFQLIENLHSSVKLDGIEGVEFLRNAADTMVVVRAICSFKQRESEAVFRFKSFSELHLKGGQLTFVDTVYNETLMKEFLLSGAAPKLRKFHESD